MSILLQSIWLKSKYSQELKKIGSGGFSLVYSFLDKTDNEEKALKVIEREKDEDRSEWFFQANEEVQTLLKLNDCPEVIKLLDSNVDTENDRIYMVMELAEASLDKILQDKGKIDKKLLHSLTRCLLKGLAFAHKLKIVHRDLKPANILLSKSGKFLISDWGIAKGVKNYGTNVQKSTAVGTVPYFPPEILVFQKGTEVNLFKADIYSFGLILLACCGVNQGSFYSDLNKRKKDKHDSDIDDLLREVQEVEYALYLPFIKRLCSFNPKDRPDIYEATVIFDDILKKDGVNNSDCDTNSKGNQEKVPEEKNEVKAELPIKDINWDRNVDEKKIASLKNIYEFRKALSGLEDRKQKFIDLNFSNKTEIDDDAVFLISKALLNMENPEFISITLNYANISREGLEALSLALLRIVASANQFHLSLGWIQKLQEADLIEFLCPLFAKAASLKQLSLNLRAIGISDKCIEMLAQSICASKELFAVTLYLEENVNLTDKGSTHLASMVLGLKKLTHFTVVFSMNKLVTDKTVEEFQTCLKSAQNIKQFIIQENSTGITQETIKRVKKEDSVLRFM